MTDRPIIFSAPMIRALLAGRKTMTRRLLKPQPIKPVARYVLVGTEIKTGRKIWEAHDDWGPINAFPAEKGCVTGCVSTVAPGDRLWVRESLAAKNSDLGGMLGLTVPITEVDPTRSDLCITYSADGEEAVDGADFNYAWTAKRLTVPSIHMPRWASRLTLLVTSVKIERLQDISEADARSEGVDPAVAGQDADGPIRTHRTGFARIWTMLHGAESWTANPDVVVIGFDVIRANIDKESSP
jgi:hypothetical protein